MYIKLNKKITILFFVIISLFVFCISSSAYSYWTKDGNVIEFSEKSNNRMVELHNELNGVKVDVDKTGHLVVEGKATAEGNLKIASFEVSDGHIGLYSINLPDNWESMFGIEFLTCINSNDLREKHVEKETVSDKSYFIFVSEKFGGEVSLYLDLRAGNVYSFEVDVMACDSITDEITSNFEFKPSSYTVYNAEDWKKTSEERIYNDGYSEGYEKGLNYRQSMIKCITLVSSSLILICFFTVILSRFSKKKKNR